MTTAETSTRARWEQDYLGPEYQKQTLDLGTDEEGAVVATLIRHRRGRSRLMPDRSWWQRVVELKGPEPRVPREVVLYLHGWADYFFQTELAEFFTNRGISFYALDLRKYGRSLRPGQSEGFAEDLEIYDEDLAAALKAIANDVGPDHRVHLLAHSLGGLIGCLWADRHPGVLSSLILNGPWLELQGSRFLRQIATHLVDPFVRADPRRIFNHPDMTAYWQSVSSTAHGEWDLDPRWRPANSFPFRAGWIKAVLNGHAQVSRGLKIDVPILMLLSERTLIQADWTEQMQGVDAVIDVNQMARLGLQIGSRVMVNRYSGGLHDVFLSRESVRLTAYADLGHWMRAYGASAL
ncbi:alpha-beta hydrolase superfamily lysophospholipase [Psychromicrobium silvestre]|uniref:Alpha-beta hydrolase superfamily lysophospholipase n=2 Tax=Psychromicrobium silvestre TaxID=1645614 RepID=A0A7Y9LRS1_9MICC|nr:alpha/beta hydrolase [Psychromicrobium silvestre]NYE94392.1 alpha-beta hydrolase superfamily lysophospholipase [Psychromicrobium silvestre]